MAYWEIVSSDGMGAVNQLRIYTELDFTGGRFFARERGIVGDKRLTAADERQQENSSDGDQLHLYVLEVCRCSELVWQ